MAANQSKRSSAGAPDEPKRGLMWRPYTVEEYWMRAALESHQRVDQLLVVLAEYDALLRKAIGAIEDHPAAVELRRKAESVRERQRRIASNPRSRTKDLRGRDSNAKDGRPPAFYRAKYLAYVQQYGMRGFFTSEAGEWGVYRGTLAKYIKSDLTAEEWQSFEERLREAAATRADKARRR